MEAAEADIARSAACRNSATRALGNAVHCVFDLLELDGRDLRREPIENRKTLLAKLLKGQQSSLLLNEHYEEDGAIVFREACKLGCEGIVSKRLGSMYRRGRSPHWVKVKNPNAPAVKREAEEDWGNNQDTRPKNPNQMLTPIRSSHSVSWDHFRALFVVTHADVVTLLPRAIRTRKSESLRGKNHSYRQGDTH
jgi:hypothetical protein